MATVSQLSLFAVAVKIPIDARNAVKTERKCTEKRHTSGGVLEKSKLIVNAALCLVWLAIHD